MGDTNMLIPLNIHHHTCEIQRCQDGGPVQLVSATAVLMTPDTPDMQQTAHSRMLNPDVGHVQ
eukprot:9345282-Prorocentrum_lima.AAC.1